MLVVFVFFKIFDFVLFVEFTIKNSIFFFSECTMRPSVKRKFTSLPEGFRAPVHTTNKRLLICMSVLVLSEILRQGKHFIAVLTTKCFCFTVNIVMSFEWKFSCEAFGAAGELAVEVLTQMLQLLLLVLLMLLHKLNKDRENVYEFNIILLSWLNIPFLIFQNQFD